MLSGIYVIQNSVNGKRYIGSAFNIRCRINNHKSLLNNGLHHNKHLQSAWFKYGKEVFVMKPILICSKDNVLFYEQICIDHFDSVNTGYNIAPQAGNTSGRKLNQNAVAKMANTKRGMKFSKEALCNHRKAMQSPEVRAKISASRKGKGKHPKSPEHIAAVKAANDKNYPHYEFDGKNLTVADWSKLTGVKDETIRYRIKVGWPLEIALFYKGNLRSKEVA